MSNKGQRIQLTCLCF